MWNRRVILIYPVSDLTSQQMDALAQAFVTYGSLETFANERAMFDKAAPVSGDYGATETHRQISTAATPELATAMTEALAGIAGTWYLLNAETEEFIATNDATKAGGKGLNWAVGVALVLGERVRYQRRFYEVIRGHTTLANRPPNTARRLFNRYRVPGETDEWAAPENTDDGYPAGARVMFEGDRWVNRVPNNTAQPGVNGWNRIGGGDNNNPNRPNNDTQKP